MRNIEKIAHFLREKGIITPEVGIILGTGLGRLAKDIEPIVTIHYEDIAGFPTSTVESHHGKLIYGMLAGKKVLAMQGRFHFYEGYSLQQITLPVRVMKLLGVKMLIVSNAAGAVNLDFKKGSLMLIEDHINLLPGNPLTGKNLDLMGPRFPDMSHPYDVKAGEQIKAIAREKNITLHEGVYVAVSGPCLETRAEYRYLKIIGADAVGMSTVPEVIVANHCSLPCIAISVLTDECDPNNLHPVSLAEILEVAGTAEKDLVVLLHQYIEQLSL